ncbi:FitA-like ribbon-helix-helix domain-containing protein [Longimicrobium sp.]|uniref:FitA-like ribbon-helix-helix domain-containing protein n=1 Tax=Longimicrobium sp. TaxID=2029185 RepID=UPI002E378081|nr:Arc family DNA-binding protein [Longimicrobium sp.]HEX6039017.1 Arc family DNA-binding protein [Longimicrobium sp.]
MASLTIKGIPDELLDDLRRSAEANRRSINSEVLLRLERSVGRASIDPEEFLSRVRARRARMELPPLTDEFLAEARAEGRL